MREKKNKFKQYVFDIKLSQDAHVILRLPLYHQKRNSIEKISSIVKHNLPT